MNPRELIRDTGEFFRKAGVPDPEYDAAQLLSRLCGQAPLSLRLDTDTVLDEDTLSLFRTLRDRRAGREPLQYILREAPFCGYVFYVDPRVLIPRPETELLCEWALEIISGKNRPNVLDLCCGSGCLGISIKLHAPFTSVLASDISDDALDVAKLNASRLSANVRFVQSDLFSAVADGLFDLIVSNPPYIPSSACDTLQQEVLREPRIALDGGKDGLSLYRKICREAPLHLVPGGSLLLEIGDAESDEVASMMNDAGFSSIIVRNDYRSVPRMITGILT